MHDTEPDTFVYQTWSEKFSSMLKEIGVDSESKEIGTDDVEQPEVIKGWEHSTYAHRSDRFAYIGKDDDDGEPMWLKYPSNK